MPADGRDFRGGAASGALRCLRDSDWTKILGWPGYRVWRSEINELSKRLKLWVRRKRGNLALVCSGCGRRVHGIAEVYEREVRDLPCFEYRTTVVIELYRLKCPELRIEGGEGATTAEQGAEYLPETPITKNSKGQTIYGPDDPSSSIYLIVSGKVEIALTAEDGSELLLEILRPDELFGESAFLDHPPGSERANAVEETKLMTWAISDIEGLVMKRPTARRVPRAAQRRVRFREDDQQEAHDAVGKAGDSDDAVPLSRWFSRCNSVCSDGSVEDDPRFCVPSAGRRPLGWSRAVNNGRFVATDNA